VADNNLPMRIETRADEQTGLVEVPLPEGMGGDLRTHLGILSRRWVAILACTVIVACLMLLYTFHKTPLYRASARLLIERRIPQLTPFDTSQSVQDEAYFQTQLALITSHDVLQKAIDSDSNGWLTSVFTGGEDAGLRNPGLVAAVREKFSTVMSSQPTRTSEPWEQLRNVVQVKPVPNTNLVDVIVESTSPDLSAHVANAVARAYVDYSVASRQENAGQTFDLLQNQRREQEVALKQAEDALLAYTQKVGIPELAAGNGDSVVSSRLKRLGEEFTAIQLQRIGLSVASKACERAIKAGGDITALLGVKSIREDPTVAWLNQQIAAADQQLKADEQVYGSKYPEVSALQSQLTDLHSQLDEALKQAAASTQGEYQMLSDREQELQALLDQQNKIALDAEGKASTYESLRADVDRQERVFNAIVDRMKEVDLTKDARVTNVSLKQAAATPRMPFSPNKPRALMLGIILGLMLGVGAAYGLEWLDDTVKTPPDVERRLRVPWLGYVPRIQVAARNGDSFSSRARFVFDNPAAYESEAFRTIRTNVHFSAPRDELKSIVITSANPQEGKTVVATNLAAMFAQAGGRILLVDTDLRRPMVHKVLGLDRKPGFSDIIVQGLSPAEVIHKLERDTGNGIGRLYVLTAGSRVPNPSELLGSQFAARVMESLEKSFDLVIYDSAPALFSSDAAPLAHRCDGVLLVAKAGKCRQRTAAWAIRQMEDVGGNIIGVVLNDVRSGILRAYASDGYHYHSNYYRQYAQYSDATVEGPEGLHEPDEVQGPGA
jgi:succinoglycan biosynthesis transport protein ExoP